MIFQLVTQDGSLKELRGIDLYHTIQAEGITDPIIQVTIRPEPGDQNVLSLLRRLVMAEELLFSLVQNARARGWNVQPTTKEGTC